MFPINAKSCINFLKDFLTFNNESYERIYACTYKLKEETTICKIYMYVRAYMHMSVHILILYRNIVLSFRFSLK